MWIIYKALFSLKSSKNWMLSTAAVTGIWKVDFHENSYLYFIWGDSHLKPQAMFLGKKIIHVCHLLCIWTQ